MAIIGKRYVTGAPNINIWIGSAGVTPDRVYKDMLGILNGTGSGKVVRIYRVRLLNAQARAISTASQVGEINIIRSNSMCGGSQIDFTPCVWDFSSVPEEIVVAVNTELGTGQVLRSFAWISEELTWSSTGTAIQGWESCTSFGIPIDFFGDDTLQPIILREGEAFGIRWKNLYTSSVVSGVNQINTIDCFIDLTIADA